jgi:putrescine transport system ATP-binding protein
MKPAILLLDEPMAALDRGLRAEVQRELIAIQRAVGTTFIVVTHDQEEALAMSDHIAIMDKGRIVQFGEPRALYERPRSRFVASVLGHINLFEGAAEARGPGQALFRTTDGLEFVVNHESGLAAATVSAAGFRPERLLVSSTPAGLPNELPGVVEQVTYGGTVTRATIRVAGGRLLDATLVNGSGSTGAGLAAGDAVHVGLPADAAVLLTE